MSTEDAPALTRIQMALLLQSADPFTACTARQTVRIASIAHQRKVAAGSPLYSRNDPADALYCVARGEVKLVSGNGGDRRVGEGETFGVREILSNRLRSEDSVAASDCVVLEVTADDFFDLLSNNIEIVKALFRQLLRNQGEEAVAPPREVQRALAAR